MNPLSESKRLPWSMFAVIGGSLCLVLGGVLAATNPQQNKYEQFASEQLTLYAKENICQATSPGIDQVIRSQMCHMMVETGKAQIPRVVRETTTRNNYFLFSIYDTNLYFYKFRTIGIFNNFYVLDIDQLYDQN